MPDQQIVGAGGQPVRPRPLKRVFRLEEFRVDFRRAAEIEAADLEHLVQRDIAAECPVDRGDRVYPADAPLEGAEVGRGHKVGLVQEDHVGEGHLLHRLVVGVEVGRDMLRVHHGHDRVETEAAAHLVVREEGLRDGRGVGEARRLYEDAVQPVLALEEAPQDADQVAAHGAADAPVVHLEKLLVALDDELVVDAHLAKLVLDHGQLSPVPLREDPVEQGCLSGAEESGEDGDGYRVCFHACRLQLNPNAMARQSASFGPDRIGGSPLHFREIKARCSRERFDIIAAR